jgi:Holliday junction resolvasome RuvABC endonuclease subunit
VRVLGIDPGMAHCGFAVVESFAVRDLGVLITSKRKGGIMARLAELEDDLGELFTEHRPGVVVAEAPSFPRSARAAHMLGLVFGLVRGMCHGRAQFVVRTAAEWRELLGLPKEKRGEAGKRERKASTARLIRRRYPGAIELLASTPGGKHEHAYDALAIASTWTQKATAAKTAATRTRRAA